MKGPYEGALTELLASSLGSTPPCAAATATTPLGDPQHEPGRSPVVCCDLVVSDRNAAHPLKAAGMDRRYGCRVFATLEELVAEA